MRLNRILWDFPYSLCPKGMEVYSKVRFRKERSSPVTAKLHLVPMLEAWEPRFMCSKTLMHSHAGAWEREIKSDALDQR